MPRSSHQPSQESAPVPFDSNFPTSVISGAPTVGTDLNFNTAETAARDPKLENYGEQEEVFLHAGVKQPLKRRNKLFMIVKYILALAAIPWGIASMAVALDPDSSATMSDSIDSILLSLAFLVPVIWFLACEVLDVIKLRKSGRRIKRFSWVPFLVSAASIAGMVLTITFVPVGVETETETPDLYTSLTSQLNETTSAVTETVTETVEAKPSMAPALEAPAVEKEPVDVPPAAPARPSAQDEIYGQVIRGYGIDITDGQVAQVGPAVCNSYDAGGGYNAALGVVESITGHVGWQATKVVQGVVVGRCVEYAELTY